MTLQELIDICEKHKACDLALEALRGCATIEEVCYLRHAPAWAFWLLSHVADLPEDAKRTAERIACLTGSSAYFLRKHILDLPEDVKRMAEQKACETQYWAALLWFDVQDLPDDVKRQARRKGRIWPWQTRKDVVG
jgi:hypothetical protein